MNIAGRKSLSNYLGYLVISVDLEVIFFNTRGVTFYKLNKSFDNNNNNKLLIKSYKTYSDGVKKRWRSFEL